MAASLAREVAWRVLLVWAVGCAALLYGRALVRRPERTMWVGDWIAIELARCSGNAKLVADRERALLEPVRVQGIGRRSVEAGYACLVIGAVQLAVSVLQVLVIVLKP